MRSAHVKCGTQMQVRRNEVRVLETLYDGTPDRLWHADLYECPACGEQMVAGFGTKPVSERGDLYFAADVDRGVDVTVSGRLLALPPERAE